MKITQANKRFRRFQSELRFALGNKSVMTEDGQVIVFKDEFNEQRIFRTLQRAIDDYARHLPSDFVNP